MKKPKKNRASLVHHSRVLMVGICVVVVGMLPSCRYSAEGRMQPVYKFTITEAIVHNQHDGMQAYDGYPMTFSTYHSTATSVERLVLAHCKAKGKFPRAGMYFATDLRPYADSTKPYERVDEAAPNLYRLALNRDTYSKLEVLNGCTVYTVYDGGRGSEDDGGRGNDVVLNVFVGY